MLSYRHAYHAGNHADVLKHLTLMLCLEHFNTKDKPYLALDTHAGAGAYSLTQETAQRTGEYRAGIERLLSHEGLCEPLRRYLVVVRSIDQGRSRLANYPGSPWILRATSRPQDRLRFCEMHSTDYALLRREFGDERRIQVLRCDGFEQLKAALPPASRRGLVLIDPSYEIKTDYAKVVAAIKDALTRFATGTYLIWYPQLPLLEAQTLPERLRKVGARSWLQAELHVGAPSAGGRGMSGSGMFVINPPWLLRSALELALPQLAQILAQDASAHSKLDAYEQPVEK